MRSLNRIIIAVTLIINLPLPAWAEQRILLVRNPSEKFAVASDLLKKDLSKYSVADFVLSKDTTLQDFESKIKEKNPDLLVLLDNRAVNFAMQYNREQTDPSKRRRGIAMMALNLRKVLKGDRYISGIAFETPVYTLMTQFRFIAERPLKRVLVFYRKSQFEEVIRLSTEQLATEGMILEAVNAEKEGASPEQIEKFLKSNLKEYVLGPNSRYDAVWVMLDSVLISPRVFKDEWLPVAKEAKIPFLTGVEELASPPLNFASFALTPNLPNLAGQGTQMIEAILESKIPPSELGVEEVISVSKFVNVGRTRGLNIKLREENLSDVKIIK